MKLHHFALSLFAGGLLAAACTFLTAARSPDPRVPAAAEDDQDDMKVREKLVRRMFEQMGMAETVKQSMEGMLELMKDTPGLPEGFIDEFKKQMDVDELLELTVPVYTHEYDVPTLERVVEFYDTKPGKRLLAGQTKVTLESQKVGAEWGRKLGMKVATELGAK